MNRESEVFCVRTPHLGLYELIIQVYPSFSFFSIACFNILSLPSFSVIFFESLCCCSSIFSL